VTVVAVTRATRRARRRDTGERAGEAVVVLFSPPRNRPYTPETAPRRIRRERLRARRVEQAAAEHGHGRTPVCVDDGRHYACDDGRFEAEREGRATDSREGLVGETRSRSVFSVRIRIARKREREPRRDDVASARARSRDGGDAVAGGVARSSRDRSNRNVARSRDGGDESRARRRAVVEDAPRRREKRARRRVEVEAQLEPNEVARPGEDVAPPRVVRQTHLVRLERSTKRHGVFHVFYDVVCLRHVVSLRVRGGSGRTECDAVQREPLFERDGAGGAVHRDALRARRGARRGALRARAVDPPAEHRDRPEAARDLRSEQIQVRARRRREDALQRDGATELGGHERRRPETRHGGAGGDGGRERVQSRHRRHRRDARRGVRYS